MNLPPRALPNKSQAELLDIIFAEPRTAARAWEQWIANTDLDLLEGESVRLLPLLHARLRSLGIEHAESARLKGIHHKSWMANTIRFARLKPLLGLLAAEGIPVMALKGAPLAIRYYADIGQRLMSDVDLLVPEERIADAWRLLHAHGWNAANLPASWRLSRARVRHSDTFSNGGDTEFDLHWHSLLESAHTPVDQAFWDQSEAGAIAGEPVRFPCATDLLLLSMVHGIRADEGTPFRWIADALTLLRHPDVGIDWPRFQRLARELQMGHAMGAGMDYLRNRFRAELPEAVAAELQAPPPTPFERTQYRILSLPWSGGRTLRYLWLLYLRFSNQTRVPAWRRRRLGFIPFLREYFVLHSIFQLPGFFAGKIVDRLRRRFGGASGQAGAIVHQ